MSTPLRVLIIEDSQDDTDILLRQLRKGGYDPFYRRVDTPDTMNSVLKDQIWDLIIADYSMPSFNAVDALEILKSQRLDVPFIIVSGSIGEDVAVSAMKSGAHDYIMKNNLARLIPTIERELRETEMRKAKRDAEEKFRILVEQSLVGIYIIQDEKYIYVNPKFSEIFGYTQDEILSLKSLAALVFENDRRLVLENIQKRISGEIQVAHYTFRGLRKNGNVIEVEAQGSRANINQKPSIIGTLLDITARKQLESQLVHAQKMEVVGTLAGGIAHDFNNLLTTIIGNAEMALDHTNLDTSITESLKDIHLAGERASELTKQLLLFSRKTPPQFQSCDIHSLLEESHRILKRTLGPSINIIVKKEAKHFKFLGDPNQIQQVILNLAVNARDAMTEGGQLALQTENVSIDKEYCKHILYAYPGDFIVLSITDTGIGMDQETQKHIFEPFFTTKGIGKGTGLGLSVIYGVIKNHHGWINVYSEPAHGTTFKIYIPLEQYLPESEKQDSDYQTLPHGHETILLIDDDLMVLRLGKELLGKLGYTVLTADGPAKGLQIYQEKSASIHLVITDWLIPGMEGQVLIQRLRKINSKVKIILCSGADIPLNGKTQSIKGVQTFIVKPFRLKNLAQSVREVLDKQ